MQLTGTPKKAQRRRLLHDGFRLGGSERGRLQGIGSCKYRPIDHVQVHRPRLPKPAVPKANDLQGRPVQDQVQELLQEWDECPNEKQQPFPQQTWPRNLASGQIPVPCKEGLADGQLQRPGLRRSVQALQGLQRPAREGKVRGMQEGQAVSRGIACPRASGSRLQGSFHCSGPAGPLL